MNLYDQLTELVTQYPDSWDYYRIHRNKSIDSFFVAPSSFINQTFMYASKRLLFSEDDTDKYIRDFEISAARSAHSIATFFIGALIARKFHNGIFNCLFTDRQRTHGFSFSYIWTLTCLYHDFGYAFEQDIVLTQRLARSVEIAKAQNILERRAIKSPYWLGLANFRKELNIRQSVWKTQCQCCSGNCQSSQDRNIVSRRNCTECFAISAIVDSYKHAPKVLYLKDSTISFPARPSNDISRYFAYRLLSDETIDKRSCIDHGIAGGLLFFDRIIKNYARAYRYTCSNNGSTNVSDFVYPSGQINKLMRFSFYQIPLFAYIADCIINHNIWSATGKTPTGIIYEKMGLESLLVGTYKKVNFVKNPLLFLLAVSDSIECLS